MEYHQDYLIYRFNVCTKTIALWKKLNLIQVNKKKLIDETDIKRITKEFIYLYRYATYENIMNYFNCSKDEAKKLWINEIIKEIELVKFKGYAYPRFLWKDIIDYENEIRETIRIKKGKIINDSLNNSIFEDVINMFNQCKESSDIYLKEEKLFQIRDLLFSQYNNNNRKMSYDDFNVFYELSKQVFEEIITQSSNVLSETNRKYGLQLSYDYVIDPNIVNLFHHRGITGILKYKGIIDSLLSQQLTDVISQHPKNDYSETRNMKRTFYIHCGETNSGKTYSSLNRLKEAKNGVYLGPLRLLVLEVYKNLNQDEIPCNLVTGEEEIIIEAASHTASTIEKLNIHDEYEVAVIDEAQMIEDPYRGSSWTKAIFGVNSKEIHICTSESAVDIIKMMIEDCNDDYYYIEHKRETELVVENEQFHFHQSVREGDALIVFSRKNAIHIGAILNEKGFSCSIIYGDLPPETRMKQFEQFLKKETIVLVSTDAIGMGVNLPIRRIVFLEVEKYDGYQRRALSVSEIKQIAGRAGRKNIYDIGFVNCTKNKKEIKKKLSMSNEKIKVIPIPLPVSVILNLPYGTLRERLIAWQNHKYAYLIYKKSSLDTLLKLLKHIEHLADQISMENMLKLIMIPFNIKDESLISLWRNYCYSIANNEDIIIPKMNSNEVELEILENDYQRLNICYAFGKVFKKEINFEYIQKLKDEISNKIFIQLNERIKRYKKKCSECGSELQWDHFYAICNSCYNARFDYDDEYY